MDLWTCGLVGWWCWALARCTALWLCPLALSGTVPVPRGGMPALASVSECVSVPCGMLYLVPLSLLRFAATVKTLSGEPGSGLIEGQCVKAAWEDAATESESPTG